MFVEEESSKKVFSESFRLPFCASFLFGGFGKGKVGKSFQFRVKINKIE